MDAGARKQIEHELCMRRQRGQGEQAVGGVARVDGEVTTSGQPAGRQRHPGHQGKSRPHFCTFTEGHSKSSGHEALAETEVKEGTGIEN